MSRIPSQIEWRERIRQMHKDGLFLTRVVPQPVRPQQPPVDPHANMPPPPDATKLEPLTLAPPAEPEATPEQYAKLDEMMADAASVEGTKEEVEVMARVADAPKPEKPHKRKRTI